MPVDQTMSQMQNVQPQQMVQQGGMPPVNQGMPGQMMPNEGKKSIFKKWWFWLIVVVLLGVSGFGLYAVFTS